MNEKGKERKGEILIEMGKKRRGEKNNLKITNLFIKERSTLFFLCVLRGKKVLKVLASSTTGF